MVTSRSMSSLRKRGPGIRLGEELARTEILAGAAKVLSGVGVRATTVEDILVASRVSRRTFYRLYDDKDAVLLALYVVGTAWLVDACRTVVGQEDDPLRQIERCIDAHLRTARNQGRLVFVLGGEAQRQESPLHARRMEVHEILASLLVAGAKRHAGKEIDPLLYRGMLLALEGVTRLMLAESDEGRRITSAGIERARRVMRRLAITAIVAKGPDYPPLPTK